MLSEAKKQAPVDSIQKSELTSYIEKIKLLSNSVTLYIVKREKVIQKECEKLLSKKSVCATYTSEIKASKQKRGKRREAFVQILLLLRCNRATVLSCVSVTPSISLR